MLQVVCRLQLAILHVVIFQMHERSIMVCFGTAVALPADAELFLVFGQLLLPAFERFHMFLDGCLFLSFAMDKNNTVFFALLFKEF